MKKRLDQTVVERGLVATRSQAESFIKLGKVEVNGKIITKPGIQVSDDASIVLTASEQYVSRAGLKLSGAADILKVDFNDKVILDIGSSTGGFTDYALKHGAKKVIAVDVGKDQMHPSLRSDSRIELHEQTDIRDFRTNESIDIILIDVSFISMQEILPAAANFANKNTEIMAMLKPQFETGDSAKHKGVIKNDRMRRDIIKNFELWLKQGFVIQAKTDSQVSGAKGNVERFYLLNKISL